MDRYSSNNRCDYITRSDLGDGSCKPTSSASVECISMAGRETLPKDLTSSRDLCHQNHAFYKHVACWTCSSITKSAEDMLTLCGCGREGASTYPCPRVPQGRGAFIHLAVQRQRLTCHVAPLHPALWYGRFCWNNTGKRLFSSFYNTFALKPLMRAIVIRQYKDLFRSWKGLSKTLLFSLVIVMHIKTSNINNTLRIGQGVLGSYKRSGGEDFVGIFVPSITPIGQVWDTIFWDTFFVWWPKFTWQFTPLLSGFLRPFCPRK